MCSRIMQSQKRGRSLDPAGASDAGSDKPFGGAKAPRVALRERPWHTEQLDAAFAQWACAVKGVKSKDDVGALPTLNTVQEYVGDLEEPPHHVWTVQLHLSETNVNTLLSLRVYKTPFGQSKPDSDSDSDSDSEIVKNCVKLEIDEFFLTGARKDCKQVLKAHFPGRTVTGVLSDWIAAATQSITDHINPPGGVFIKLYDVWDTSAPVRVKITSADIQEMIGAAKQFREQDDPPISWKIALEYLETSFPLTVSAPARAAAGYICARAPVMGLELNDDLMTKLETHGFYGFLGIGGGNAVHSTEFRTVKAAFTDMCC